MIDHPNTDLIEISLGDGRRISAPEVSHHSRNLAAEFNVAPALNGQDFMLHFALQQSRDDWQRGLRSYFEGGRADAELFATVVCGMLGFTRESPISILEFAAGYGRVSRHLPGIFSKATITTVDIHDRAVQFLNEQIGVTSLASSAVPEGLHLPQSYDVAFALSFFSHMPPATFGRWIASLFRTLRRGGFLVFTTAGREGYARDGRKAEDFDGKVAVFVPTSEQRDLDSNEYGGMFVTPDYVISQIYTTIQAPIAVYRANFWWACQDLWVVAKP